MRLNHLPSPGCSVSRCTARALSQVCVCLLRGADLRLRPSWQDPRKTWLATGSLLTVWWRMPSLRLRLPLAFRLRLLHTCLSASSRGHGGKRPACSQLALLWYSLNPLFCEPVRLCVSLEPFVGKFSVSFLFSLSLVVPQFGMLSHVSSLRLSSGHSGPVLTLSTDYAAHVPVFSPCSLVVDGSLCWQLQLGTCSVGFFSSRLCCPLRFQNSPQALL